MKRRDFLHISAVTGLSVSLAGANNLIASPSIAPIRKIFVTGGGYDETTFRFLISLTGKQNPKICFLPTPVGDSQIYIDKWFEIAKALPIQPFVQKVFITSYEQKTSFETTLLSMDAILVTGGNTLNAIALWKAQGIDRILRQAWQRGIVLTGPSAGAICWFEQGLSDSRPAALSVVEGLGILRGSFCPHYHTEEKRNKEYPQMIEQGRLLPGYACDETAGLYFENEVLKRVITQKEDDKAFRVSQKNEKKLEEPLDSELIERKQN